MLPADTPRTDLCADFRFATAAQASARRLGKRRIQFAQLLRIGRWIAGLKLFARSKQARMDHFTDCPRILQSVLDRRSCHRQLEPRVERYRGKGLAPETQMRVAHRLEGREHNADRRPYVAVDCRAAKFNISRGRELYRDGRNRRKYKPAARAQPLAMSRAISTIMSSCPPTILRLPTSARMVRVSTP